MRAEQQTPSFTYSEEDLIPSWLKLESGFWLLDEEPSCYLVIKSIDWEKMRLGRNVSLPESQPHKLIKYSEAQFSPVSSLRAESIQLASPSFYQDVIPDVNSTLVSDEFESAFIEELSWNKKGSAFMEHVKTQYRKSPYGFGNCIQGNFTFGCSQFWMYCTAIDSQTRRGREIQWKHLSPNYNFMTCIENPPDFAQQLGIAFARQGAFKNNVRCDFPGMVSINSVLLMNTIADWYDKTSAEGIPEGATNAIRNFLSRTKEGLEVYVIHVCHGAVIYFDKDRIAPFMAEVPEFQKSSILPFIKQSDYAEQQEYRFVISVQHHTPVTDTLYLTVSDELRRLMSPLGTAPRDF